VPTAALSIKRLLHARFVEVASAAVERLQSRSSSVGLALTRKAKVGASTGLTARAASVGASVIGRAFPRRRDMKRLSLRAKSRLELGGVQAPNPALERTDLSWLRKAEVYPALRSQLKSAAQLQR
jgi:hypothetical protein